MKRVEPTHNFFTTIILVFLLSCSGNQTVFEEYQKFDNLSWSRFNILKFEVNLEDIESSYDIYINIRHLPEVSYKEMVINFTIFTASGDMRTTDYTLKFYDREGKKLSECLGDYCDLLVPLRESFRFYETGRVRFEIENKFTKIKMPGILEVGLIMKKSTERE